MLTIVYFSEGTEGVRFYINGKLDVSIAMFSTTAQNSLNIRFGYSAAGSADYFVGKMDDISIWGRALSEEEIIVSPWKRFAGDEIGMPVQCVLVISFNFVQDFWDIILSMRGVVMFCMTGLLEADMEKYWVQLYGKIQI